MSRTYTVTLLVLITLPAMAVNFTNAGPMDPTASSTGINEFEDKPSLATDGNGHWVAVWEMSETVTFGSADNVNIAVATSSDNGTTWTDPEWLNSNAETDFIGEASPTLATDGNGNWVCAYAGLSPPPTPIRPS